MQSLKIIFLMSFFIGAAHAQEMNGKKIFSVVVTRKYSQESSQVFKNKSELYCKTEQMPYFVISKKSTEQSFLEQMKAMKSESIKNCPAHEFLKLTQGRSLLTLCLENPKAKAFLDRLARDCGRKL